MQRAIALFSISLATMLFAIDISIVNTALPAIQLTMKLTYLDLRWIIDIFSIFLVSLLIPAGLIGDKVSEHRSLLIALVVFFIGCAIAGFARNFYTLLAGRAVQGIAMASLFPTSLAVFTHLYPPEQKTKAVSIWSMCSGIGLALGPVIGGVLLSIASWHWVFLFNLPLIALSFILGATTLKGPPKPRAQLHLRWHSILLFAAATSALITAVLEQPNWGFASPILYITVAAGLLMMLLFYFAEHKQVQPLVNFQLFRHPVFFKASCITFYCGFMIYSLLYLSPLYLHTVLKYRGYTLGLLMLPISASLVIGSRMIPWLISHMPLRRLLVISLLIMALANLMQLHFSTANNLAYIICTFILIGFGCGIAYAGATTYSLTVIPDECIHSASSVFMTVRNLGGGLGLAIAGTIFYHFRTAALSNPHFSHLGAATLHKISFLYGYYAVFIFVAVLALVGASLFIHRANTR